MAAATRPGWTWLLAGLLLTVTAEAGWIWGQDGRLAAARAHAARVSQPADPSGARRGISWISSEMEAEREPLKAVAHGEAEWLESFFLEHNVPDAQAAQVREILYLHAKRLTSVRSRARWAGFLDDEVRDLMAAEQERRGWLLRTLLGPDLGADLDARVQAEWGHLLNTPP